MEGYTHVNQIVKEMLIINSLQSVYFSVNVIYIVFFDCSDRVLI